VGRERVGEAGVKDRSERRGVTVSLWGGGRSGIKEMDGIFLSVTGGIGLKETRMSSEEKVLNRVLIES
jgi:hypothetical protein